MLALEQGEDSNHSPSNHFRSNQGGKRMDNQALSDEQGEYVSPETAENITQNIYNDDT